YQEELLTQNEELRRAQSALEESRNRLSELFDFAPNGYLTLDIEGTIRQVNLTAALMFGKHRHMLEGLPFAAFVVPGDRAAFMDLLRRYRAGAGAGTGAGAGAGRPDFSIDLAVKTADGPKPVQLICRIELDQH